MNSQMYSIKKELLILRRFVDMEYDGSRRCYSVEDISAAEERLHYKLPLPIRELYLYMSDILLDTYDLRSLELLHWQQDYLCFFDPPEGDAVGICRKDDPNALYTWDELIPEEDQTTLYDLDEEFEAFDEEGDAEGKNAVALKHSACWDNINSRYTEAPPCLKKLEYESRCYCSLDAYGLFLVIHALLSYAIEFFCLKNLNCHLADLPMSSEREPDYFEKLRESIEQEFTPVSEHLELIDIFPLPMAYVHKTENALLICDEELDFLTLLSDKTAGPGFIEKIQNCLSLPLRRNQMEKDMEQ